MKGKTGKPSAMRGGGLARKGVGAALKGGGLARKGVGMALKGGGIARKGTGSDAMPGGKEAKMAMGGTPPVMTRPGFMSGAKMPKMTRPGMARGTPKKMKGGGLGKVLTQLSPAAMLIKGEMPKMGLLGMGLDAIKGRKDQEGSSEGRSPDQVKKELGLKKGGKVKRK